MTSSKRKSLFRVIVFGFLSVLAAATGVHSRDFFCASGDINCLFNSISEAKYNGEANTIFLDNGTYSGMQLPSISGPFPLTITGHDPAQTIVRGGQSLSQVFFITPGGTLTLDRLTVTGATAGGIVNTGTLLLTYVIVGPNSNFSSGAGISNSGTAEILSSTVRDNASIDSSGGGIYNPGVMTIADSTIAGNTGGGAITSGNGIQNSGTLHVVNTTIARNSRPAEVRGGGIDNLGNLEITNSTISENRGTSGGGIANVDTATTVLRNTILAGNSGGASAVFEPGGPDCAGAVISLGNNLIGDPQRCGITLQPSDITGNPGLAAFTENTSVPGSGHYPLLPNSLAIDSGDSQGCPETDQLDNARSGNCDIGSTEFPRVIGERVVSIGITPQKAANNIDPGKKKNIDVTIFSGNGVEIDTISRDTVRFGASGTEGVPKKVRDKDSNRDKTRDLVLRFNTHDLGISCGLTTLILTGQFTDGQSFSSSTSITTKCKQKG